MGTYNFEIICDCQSCGIVLFSVANADPGFWKKDANIDGGHSVRCNQCGCEYRTIDDNVPTALGGGVSIRNEAKPQIRSIVNTNGPLSGGTVIKLLGHGFLNGIPTISINDTNVIPNVISDSELEIVMPAGSIQLVIADQPYTKLSIGNVSNGSFIEGEYITDTATGSNARVKLVKSRYIMVSELSNILVRGSQIIGNNSSATTTLIEDAHRLDFVIGEQIIGLSSGSIAIVISNNKHIKIKALSGKFEAGEKIWGRISGACVTLDDKTPMNGFVDITVSNTWGKHYLNSSIKNAFEYRV